MFRLCFSKHAPRHASLIATLPRCAGCYRTYATDYTKQSSHSWTKERRYYTDPLRAPQSGVSSDVAIRADATSLAKVNDTTRCLMIHPNLKTQLMEILSAHGRTVCYNSAGVPVEGSWYLLPWREQMRILAAVIGALCITKAFFDGVRFELLYYGVWKLGYRNDDSVVKRMLYYGSTALMASGLFLSFNLNFFLSAWLVGRREIAAHMVCNAFAYMMPRRAIQLMERRLKLRLV